MILLDDVIKKIIQEPTITVISCMDSNLAQLINTYFKNTVCLDYYTYTINDTNIIEYLNSLEFIKNGTSCVLSLFINNKLIKNQETIDDITRISEDYDVSFILYTKEDINLPFIVQRCDLWLSATNCETLKIKKSRRFLFFDDKISLNCLKTLYRDKLIERVLEK